MISYIVKENRIGSAVSKILPYRQINTDRLLLLYNKDYFRGTRIYSMHGGGA